MVFFRTLRYIEYLMFAGHRRGHGIHSPFVFDLVNRVFRNKRDAQVVLTIENLRKKNISDQRTIDVLDLGAGSYRMKTNSRRVSEIARYTAVPAKYGLLLANLAAEYGNPSVVEFGTSLGISTMYLASGCPGSVVYTMEGCPDVCLSAKENFREGGFGNITLMDGSFDNLLPLLRKKNVKPGLAFIDGDHKKEPVIRYVKELRKMSEDDLVIVIDDIHYSSEMEDAWNEIGWGGNVTLTIDLYRMGLVFFRKGLIRSGYTIRY